MHVVKIIVIIIIVTIHFSSLVIIGSRGNDKRNIKT